MPTTGLSDGASACNSSTRRNNSLNQAQDVDYYDTRRKQRTSASGPSICISVSKLAPRIQRCSSRAWAASFVRFDLRAYRKYHKELLLSDFCWLYVGAVLGRAGAMLKPDIQLLSFISSPCTHELRSHLALTDSSTCLCASVSLCRLDVCVCPAVCTPYRTFSAAFALVCGCVRFGLT
jgi:hypothetical protein